MLRHDRSAGTRTGIIGKIRSVGCRIICFDPWMAIILCGSAVSLAPPTKMGNHVSTSKSTSGQPCFFHRNASAPPKDPLFFSAGSLLAAYSFPNSDTPRSCSRARSSTLIFFRGCDLLRTWGPRQCTHQRSGRFCTARRDSRGAAEEEEEAVWESTLETLGEATCDLWAEARVALEGFAATGQLSTRARISPGSRRNAPRRRRANPRWVRSRLLRVFPKRPWSWYSAAAR